jgi:hypothetical protein
MRLGKLPHDPARFDALPSHAYGATPAPPKIVRSPDLWTPALVRNDVLPDCTAVALWNSARAEAWNAFGGDIVGNDAQVISFFARSIGKPDATEAELEAAPGAVALDVVNLAQQTGFDIGQQTPLVPVVRTIGARDRNGMANAVARDTFYFGVYLYEADMAAAPSTPWDIATPAGDPVGGHMIFAWAYTGLGDADRVLIGTWGYWRWATWAWVFQRTQEAYAVSWPQLTAAPRLDAVA